jgi:hypothetical protein
VRDVGGSSRRGRDALATSVRRRWGGSGVARRVDPSGFEADPDPGWDDHHHDPGADTWDDAPGHMPWDDDDGAGGDDPSPRATEARARPGSLGQTKSPPERSARTGSSGTRGARPKRLPKMAQWRFEEGR